MSFGCRFLYTRIIFPQSKNLNPKHIVLHNSEKCCNLAYKVSKQQMFIFYIKLTKVSYFLSLNIKFLVYFYYTFYLFKVK